MTEFDDDCRCAVPSSRFHAESSSTSCSIFDSETWRVSTEKTKWQSAPGKDYMRILKCAGWQPEKFDDNKTSQVEQKVMMK